MSNRSHQKGSKMPKSLTAKTKSKVASRLNDLRVKNACRIHKAHGEAEEIRNEGLSVYSGFAKLRKRANETAYDK